MNTLTRWAISLSIVAGAGIVAVVVLTVISGIDYRLAEDAGGEIPETAGWIVAGTYLGMAVFALATAGLVAVGVIALTRRINGGPGVPRARA